MERLFEVQSASKICFQLSFNQHENAFSKIISMSELAHLIESNMKPIFTINET
ncbi:hypothetical protein ACQKM9_14995 [Viridibacillus sp. NPDC093762]|uniref:hypothetical protein n=1 Tax=Viridibacillus sp. NPDC093762 TaxID=3390720 RepID=UPI003D09245E